MKSLTNYLTALIKSMPKKKKSLGTKTCRSRKEKDLKNKKVSKEQAKEEKKQLNSTIELLDRKIKYEQKKEILGKRNSYSKTDNDAIAMMMKDKLTVRPAYNEGIAVE